MKPELAVQILERARQNFGRRRTSLASPGDKKYRMREPSANARWLSGSPASLRARNWPPKTGFPACSRPGFGRRTHSYQIDVQPIARGAKHGPVRQLRAGKRVTVQVADERGSLSAYVEPLAGGRALISGHVAVRQGNRVTAVAP